MIESINQAADYVAENWEVTHASFKVLGVPTPYCCAFTRQAMVEIALEHELGLPAFAEMNHVEAAVLMIDLMRRGMEQISGATVGDLLRDLGLEPRPDEEA